MAEKKQKTGKKKQTRTKAAEEANYRELRRLLECIKIGDYCAGVPFIPGTTNTNDLVAAFIDGFQMGALHVAHATLSGDMSELQECVRRNPFRKYCTDRSARGEPQEEHEPRYSLTNNN